MIKILVPLCTVTVLSGCGPSPADSPVPSAADTLAVGTTVNATTAAYSDLVLKLIGEWHDIQGDGKTVFHEQWERTDDAYYTGLGFVMSGKDTVFIEHLNMHYGDDGSAYYAARIPSQNEGEPVEFRLTSAAGDSMVFENNEHDFPQRIVYAWQHDGTWQVNVAGPGKEGWRTDRYHFRRRGASPD